MNQPPVKIRWTRDCVFSCFLFRVWPEEMLVCFLQHVKYHAFVSGTENKLTATAYNYLKTLIKTNKTAINPSAAHQLEYSSQEKYTRIKCLKLLKTVLSDLMTSSDEKTDRLNAAVLQCRDIIVQRHQYEEKLRLGLYEMMLPADFVVTCFIYRISAQHMILDFFAQIDYLGHLASRPENKPAVHPALNFFFLYAAQYGHMPAELMDEDGNFYQQYLEHIASTFQIGGDIANRREQLMKVATNWFWASERFNIPRSEFARSIKMVRMSACKFRKLNRRWRL